MSNKVFYKDKLMIMIDDHLSYIKNNKRGKTLYLVSKSLLRNGKKIRPLIFLNIVEARSFQFEDEIGKLAISIEMLHCASLIIDDLPSMDNDKLRRGEETVHVKYGVKKAHMLANKYILEAIGNILEICGKNVDDNGECKKLILKEIRDACIGQFYDISGITNSDNNEMSNIINLKTAPFFNIAFILAAYFTREGYKEYIKLGNIFSSMFQICDDIEDHQSDLKKGHTMNHCILMGRGCALELYKDRRTEFIDRLMEAKLYIPYFIYLIDLLDKKVGLDL